MSLASTSAAPAVAPSKGLHIGLWVGQVALAAMFGMAGVMKLTKTDMFVAHGLPYALVLFIGISEVAGTLGVILPAATRIKPGLTPLAALGFLVIMVLATLLHASKGEFNSVATTVVLGAIAGFVAWGRWKKAPIAPKS